MLIDFVGNKQALIELEYNIKNDELSHGYLFLGREGVGKFTAAKAFASRLLEPDRKDLIYRQDYQHQDLRIIRSEDSIKKSQIEDLIKDSKLKPFSSKYKVYIIDNFDEVTISGQNAMLKMLEEPEDYLKIILISSSSENILPTIMSRSRIIKFRDIPVKQIEDFLKTREGLSDKNSKIFARVSSGSMKRALRLANDPEYLQLRDKTIEVFDKLINIGDYTFRNKEFFMDESKILDIFDFAMSYLKDIVYINNSMPEYISNIDKIEFVKKQNIATEKIIEISEAILQVKKLLRENVNYELSIENFLIRIGGIWWLM